MIALVVIVALIFSLMTGQLLRVPILGQSGGLLVSDLAVMLTLIAAYARPISPVALRYVLLCTPFILWSLLTLILAGWRLELSEVFIAGAYWARTSAYLLLLPALLQLCSNRKVYTALQSWFSIAILFLVGLGAAQLFLWPNLSALPPFILAATGGGWDPHEARLVATWLDPNFMGAFFGIAVITTTVFALEGRRRARLYYSGLSGAAALAFAATQSRSSLVAALSVIFVFSPFVILRASATARRSSLPKAVAAISVITLVLSLTVVKLGDRARGLFTFDPTVAVRQESLANLWSVAQEHLIIGVGYNAFQFFSPTDNPALHSRAGADNSFLTLLITTGLPGVILFCLPWLVAARECGRRWLRRDNAGALAALASLLFLTVHAQFINSWLYGHLLITIAIVTALAVASPQQHELVR